MNIDENSLHCNESAAQLNHKHCIAAIEFDLYGSHFLALTSLPAMLGDRKRSSQDI